MSRKTGSGGFSDWTLLPLRRARVASHGRLLPGERRDREHKDRFHRRRSEAEVPAPANRERSRTQAATRRAHLGAARGELRPLLVVPTWGQREEARLHERFRHLRGRGEWFQGSPELRRYIRGQRTRRSLPRLLVLALLALLVALVASRSDLAGLLEPRSQRQPPPSPAPTSPSPATAADSPPEQDFPDTPDGRAQRYMQEAEALAADGDYDRALDVIRMARDEAPSFELDAEVSGRLRDSLDRRRPKTSRQ